MLKQNDKSSPPVPNVHFNRDEELVLAQYIGTWRERAWFIDCAETILKHRGLSDVDFGRVTDFSDPNENFRFSLSQDRFPTLYTIYKNLPAGSKGSFLRLIFLSVAELIHSDSGLVNRLTAKTLLGIDSSNLENGSCVVEKKAPVSETLNTGTDKGEETASSIPLSHFSPIPDAEGL